MGCTHSTPDDGDEDRRARHANTQTASIEKVPAITNVEWETNASWGTEIEGLWKRAVEAGEQDKFRADFKDIVFDRARNWVNENEPACAHAGSIQDMGEHHVCIDNQRCPYPKLLILTLDDDFTGVIFSSTEVMAPHLNGNEDDQTWLTPGAALETTEFKGLQKHVLHLTSMMGQEGINVRHALAHVIVGATMVTCRLNNAATKPTVIMISDEPGDGLKAANKQMVKDARKQPDEFRTIFRPFMFWNALQTRASNYPGSTAWDEGPFPFSVAGNAYSHPTRLLVERYFREMPTDVDAAHFLVKPLSHNSSDGRTVIMRNLNPDKDPGGIVAVTLLVAVDPQVAWPKCGQYVKTSAFKAAETALLEYVNDLVDTGKTRSCRVTIFMGSDEKCFKVVGNAPAILPKNGEESSDAANASGVLSERKQQYPDLDGFGIELQEQPKHELWESEIQFQSIKHEILNQARQNPELYASMIPQIAVRTGMGMLRMNYPECEVSDEGEFPVMMPDGTEMKISDTRLLLVRDPKQEPKSIVAALHVVPNPGGTNDFLAIQQTGWLDTKEIKGAENALLALLRSRYAQGKVSEAECLAFVMMGTDASYYQFVEGNKFIDLSDERDAQIKWG